MTPEYFILTRAVHFGACLLFFCGFAFDGFVIGTRFNGGESEIKTYWQTRLRIFNLILLPIILLSGIAWFVVVALNMSDEPLQLDILKTVWAQTQFGTVWQWRSLFWLVAMAVSAFFYFSEPVSFSGRFLKGFQLLLAGLLLGSLAWAGHGQESSNWHLLADILHLLVAGFWPAGLLPLFLLLRKLRSVGEPARTDLIVLLVRRFSILSLVSVGLLILTGLVNSWFLVGSFSNLLSQDYGRWLIAKILFFLFAIALGAVNLVRLKPRLSQPQHSEAAAAQLRRNVFIELILATAVIIIVSVLGILPPAGH